ncbi:MAG: carbon-nitrogen hydrolase family protein [Hyphomicrobiales bacterium]
MAEKFKAACIQNCATPDVHKDIETLSRLINAAADAGAKLIALPEYCAGLDTKNGLLYPFAAPEAQHSVIPAFAALARKRNAWILIGSIGIKAPDGRIFNRSFMLDPSGETVARYDKLHMYDVELGDGHSYKESATIAPGSEAVISPSPGGKLGMSVCYDLRFPGLYRTYGQAGANILAIPAAFVRLTGQAHWHVLNRARAIENGAYVIAPCQYGTLSGGSECFGHSLIVDPWGRVLADGGEDEGFVVAELDMGEVEKTRQRIPSLKHDRPFSIEGQRLAAE